jgi:uncharacterized membrane protein
MYELQCRPAGRPWATKARTADAAAQADNTQPLILHMRENRSHLSREARLCFAVIGLLFMVTSIGPALHGHWLVPAFSLAAMAALTFALERHGASRPASETLELADGRVSHRDSAGRRVELPAYWLRLATESRNPSDLRLILSGRDGAIEFGLCLSLDERREVAPLVAEALARTRGR